MDAMNAYGSSFGTSRSLQKGTLWPKRSGSGSSSNLRSVTMTSLMPSSSSSGFSSDLMSDYSSRLGSSSTPLSRYSGGGSTSVSFTDFSGSSYGRTSGQSSGLGFLSESTSRQSSGYGGLSESRQRSDFDGQPVSRQSSGSGFASQSASRQSSGYGDLSGFSQSLDYGSLSSTRQNSDFGGQSASRCNSGLSGQSGSRKRSAFSNQSPSRQSSGSGGLSMSRQSSDFGGQSGSRQGSGSGGLAMSRQSSDYGGQSGSRQGSGFGGQSASRQGSGSGGLAMSRQSTDFGGQSGSRQGSGLGGQSSARQSSDFGGQSGSRQGSGFGGQSASRQGSGMGGQSANKQGSARQRSGFMQSSGNRQVTTPQQSSNQQRSRSPRGQQSMNTNQPSQQQRNTAVDLYCNLCRTDCKSAKEYLLHRQSSSHKMEEKLLPGNQKGKYLLEHLQRLKSIANYSVHTRIAKELGETRSTEQSRHYYCMVCDQWASSSNQWKQHQRNSDHQMKLNKSENLMYFDKVEQMMMNMAGPGGSMQQGGRGGDSAGRAGGMPASSQQPQASSSALAQQSRWSDKQPQRKPYYEADTDFGNQAWESDRQVPSSGRDDYGYDDLRSRGRDQLSRPSLMDTSPRRAELYGNVDLFSKPQSMQSTRRASPRDTSGGRFSPTPSPYREYSSPDRDIRSKFATPENPWYEPSPTGRAASPTNMYDQYYSGGKKARYSESRSVDVLDSRSSGYAGKSMGLAERSSRRDEFQSNKDDYDYRPDSFGLRDDQSSALQKESYFSKTRDERSSLGPVRRLDDDLRMSGQTPGRAAQSMQSNLRGGSQPQQNTRGGQANRQRKRKLPAGAASSGGGSQQKQPKQQQQQPQRQQGGRGSQGGGRGGMAMRGQVESAGDLLQAANNVLRNALVEYKERKIHGFSLPGLETLTDNERQLAQQLRESTGISDFGIIVIAIKTLKGMGADMMDKLTQVFIGSQRSRIRNISMNLQQQLGLDGVSDRVNPLVGGSGGNMNQVTPLMGSGASPMGGGGGMSQMGGGASQMGGGMSPMGGSNRAGGMGLLPTPHNQGMGNSPMMQQGNNSMAASPMMQGNITPSPMMQQSMVLNQSQGFMMGPTPLMANMGGNAGSNPRDVVLKKIADGNLSFLSKVEPWVIQAVLKRRVNVLEKVDAGLVSTLNAVKKSDLRHAFQQLQRGDTPMNPIPPPKPLLEMNTKDITLQKIRGGDIQALSAVETWLLKAVANGIGREDLQRKGVDLNLASSLFAVPAPVLLRAAAMSEGGGAPRGMGPQPPQQEPTPPAKLAALRSIARGKIEALQDVKPWLIKAAIRKDNVKLSQGDPELVAALLRAPIKELEKALIPMTGEKPSSGELAADTPTANKMRKLHQIRSNNRAVLLEVESWLLYATLKGREKSLKRADPLLVQALAKVLPANLQWAIDEQKAKSKAKPEEEAKDAKKENEGKDKGKSMNGDTNGAKLKSNAGGSTQAQKLVKLAKKRTRTARACLNCRVKGHNAPECTNKPRCSSCNLKEGHVRWDPACPKYNEDASMRITGLYCSACEEKGHYSWQYNCPNKITDANGNSKTGEDDSKPSEKKEEKEATEVEDVEMVELEKEEEVKAKCKNCLQTGHGSEVCPNAAVCAKCNGAHNAWDSECPKFNESGPKPFCSSCESFGHFNWQKKCPKKSPPSGQAEKDAEVKKESKETTEGSATVGDMDGLEVVDEVGGD